MQHLVAVPPSNVAVARKVGHGSSSLAAAVAAAECPAPTASRFHRGPGAASEVPCVLCASCTHRNAAGHGVVKNADLAVVAAVNVAGYWGLTASSCSGTVVWVVTGVTQPLSGPVGMCCVSACHATCSAGQVVALKATVCGIWL